MILPRHTAPRLDQKRSKGSTPAIPSRLEVRKFYNGLGELVQTQTKGAKLADGSCNAPDNPDTCDVIVDVGRDTLQQPDQRMISTPRCRPRPTPTWRPATTSWAPNPNDKQPWTRPHHYDVLGRPVRVTAPDGTHQDYSYGMETMSGAVLAKTVATDARQKTTTTYTDVWGRAAKVVPPTGPGVDYGYDAPTA